jgi:hypothetical protein
VRRRPNESGFFHPIYKLLSRPAMPDGSMFVGATSEVCGGLL